MGGSYAGILNRQNSYTVVPNIDTRLRHEH